jgi:ABC-type transporter Mla subunit MlaD
MIRRERVTERISPSMLKLELKRSARPLMILAIGLAVAIAAAQYMLNNINGGIGSTHEMQFEVADATGVVPGRAEVRFEGIEAGIITDVKLQQRHAVLTVTVADKFGPVYKNAAAQLRPNTALQDMYLDIVNRGTQSAGEAPTDYVVPLSQTQSPTNLADVLNTFQPDVRARLYNLVDQFGNGLQGGGQNLRRTFALLAPFLAIAGNVSNQLAIRADYTKLLVHNAGVLSGVLASRTAQLHNVITSGTTALESLATEGGTPLRQTIQGFPTTIQSAEQVLTAVDGLEPNLQRALTGLQPVADQLPGGLDSLRSLALSADPAVQKLETPVSRLVPLATQLRPLASSLSASLRELAPQIPDVDKLTTVASHCTVQLNEFINWDASMSKWVDDLGHMVRGNANFGFYSLPVGTPPKNYTYGNQCSGATPLGEQPTPKYPGPAPAS